MLGAHRRPCMQVEDADGHQMHWDGFILPAYDDPDDIPGIEATCTKCGHTTESYGQESVSIRRCLVLLREECPRNEKNYYVTA